MWWAKRSPERAGDTRRRGGGTSNRGNIHSESLDDTRSTEADESAETVLPLPTPASRFSAGLTAEPGVFIEGYRLVRRIASGGMGEVWEAFQPRLQQTVALKLIRRDRVTDSLIRRFALELTVQGRLQHDGIARVYHADADVRQPFLAMELIHEAQRLDRYVDAHELTVRQRLELLRKVCDAVAYAHRQGVVHLDLKPSNILVRGDGQPKVIDFGGGRLLRPQEGDRHIASVFVVTPAYMSPEQARFDIDRIDERADVYALGVIGYELLAGRLPYDVRDMSVAETARLLSGQTRPDPLLALAGSARVEVSRVLDRAMAKKPRDRYRTAAELSSDLRALAEGSQTSVDGGAWSGGVRRWLRQARHIPSAGRVISAAAWLVAALCLWFLVAAVAFPSARAVVMPDVRMPDFAIHEAAWVLVLAVVGLIARRAGSGDVASMWLLLAIALGMAAFSVGVASGFIEYDAMGAASNPQARAMAFILASGIALAAVWLSCVMLLSHYERAPWCRPPTVRN